MRAPWRWFLEVNYRYKAKALLPHPSLNRIVISIYLFWMLHPLNKFNRLSCLLLRVYIIIFSFPQEEYCCKLRDILKLCFDFFVVFSLLIYIYIYRGTFPIILIKWTKIKQKIRWEIYWKQRDYLLILISFLKFKKIKIF